MSARSWRSATWDRVKKTLKRKSSRSSSASTSSVVSAGSNCSQVSDDPNGPIYSTLQTLCFTLSRIERSFARDGQLSEARQPLETFVAQVAEAQKFVEGSTTRITPANFASAHTALVILYDDTRLLSKELALDGSMKRPRRDWGEEAYQDVARRLASLQKRFGEWATLYFPQSAQPMDIFKLTGLMEGTTELFRASKPGDYLRLVYNPWTSILTTQADARVQIKLDPKRIERLERASSRDGTVGVVTIFYYPTEVGIEGKVWTVVLGELDMSGAGWLCRMLRNWNCDIGVPRWRTGLDGVRWRFDDASGGGRNRSPATPMMVTPPVTADGSV